MKATNKVMHAKRRLAANLNHSFGRRLRHRRGSPKRGVSTVPRTTLLLFLTLACGCGQSSDAPTDVSSTNNENAQSTQQVCAFDFDEAAGIIFLDTRIPPRQCRRFDIAQGSATLETIEMKDNCLTFQYTPEIEGGYTIYECTVPVSASPITIKVNKDGTPGATSFDLAECRVVKSGNLHWE
jgi:hypothetical protein